MRQVNLSGGDYPSDEPSEPDEDEMERRYHMMRCDGCGQHPEDCDCEDDS